MAGGIFGLESVHSVRFPDFLVVHSAALRMSSEEPIARCPSVVPVWPRRFACDVMPRRWRTKIAERGTHDELMALNGEYAQSWNIQITEKKELEASEAVSSRCTLLAVGPCPVPCHTPSVGVVGSEEARTYLLVCPSGVLVV